MRNFKIGAGESAQRFNGDDESAAIVWNGVESYSITAGGLRLRNVATASLPADPPDGTMVYDTTAGVVKVWNGAAWIIHGNSVPAGGGVDFSANTGTAATGAATTSELLDWYEEGTWTPNLWDTSASSSESQTYSVQVGWFCKIGRRVFFDGMITMSSFGTLSAIEQYRIGPLPYTAITATNYSASVNFGVTQDLDYSGSGIFNITGLILSNTNRILIYKSTSSGNVELVGGDIDGNASFRFSGSYIV